MQDVIGGAIQGFIKIIDKDTDEVLVDTHNDVLYGNISTALAYSLVGNPGSFLYYVAFGNGGAYVTSTGSITFRPTFGGPGSLIKDTTANLHNTIYVKKVSNYATSSSIYNPANSAYIPTGNFNTNYEDILINVTLDYTEPAEPIGAAQPGLIQQTTIDNSTFVGTNTTASGAFDPSTLVFNEIGLFAGTDNVFADNNYTRTTSEVNDFVAQTPNFSGAAGSRSKLMLTHAVFHPVQKSSNRSLEIIYTLRIQMGSI